MNTGVRTRLQSMNNGAVKSDQVIEMQRIKSIGGNNKSAKNRKSSSKERKLALQKDVDKLKMKLRHEENIHRALERAFNRPLGALPRLPPYLPPPTLELLAEVAVLEEEIVRLEEKVVHFRKDLYQEAVYISNSKRNIESFSDLYDLYPNKNLKSELSKFSDQSSSESTTGNAPTLSNSENTKGKGNQLDTNSVKSNKCSRNQKAQSGRTVVKRVPVDKRQAVKSLDQQKSQLDCGVTNEENVEERSRTSKDDNPNRVSEDIVKCLSSIFLRMSSMKNRRAADTLPFLSSLVSQENVEESEYYDPYGICSKFGMRDIGSYNNLMAIEADTVNFTRTSNSLFLFHRLKLLFRKLESVKLQDLSHQEKLAFWINIYNSCMMNAFLENGIPESPEVVVALMQKATINVGGHLLNAITIEHFILRLPYHSKLTVSKGAKSDGMTARSKFGLELSEPLVTFALSCGSWSSPAVRVYTATHVENELEAAKKEYLQAAVGISPRKFAIPKLLDWYLLDFAKDLESLLDWICLQLPSELGKEAIKCLERGNSEPHSQVIQILPYDFSFRYLLFTQ